MAERLRNIFSMDTRSLAFGRMGLGMLLLWDLLIRATQLEIFYTDVGLLPRKAVLDHTIRKWNLSIHMLSGETAVMAVMFAISAIFAVLLIIGWRTRLVTCISWFLLISLHVRNPIVLNAGDVILRLVMFWVMFLPLGAVRSIDSRERAVAPPKRYLGMATFAFMVQVAGIYTYGAMLKTGSTWHNGEATWYALQIDYFLTPFGHWARQFGDILNPMTKGVLVFELVGAALLLIPHWKVRVFTCFAFMSMHLGFRACLDIGMFSSVCCVMWSMLLPGEFWDRLKWRAPSGPHVRAGFFNQSLAIFFLFLITSWNLSNLKFDGVKVRVPTQIRWVGHMTRLDQKWNMFAPNPLKDDGWFVIPGKTIGGDEVDVFRSTPGHRVPVSYDKPHPVRTQYRDQRWRKYMRNIYRKTWKDLRLYYGKHLCKVWNAEARGRDKLSSFEIIFVKEMTKPRGEEPVVSQVSIWKHDCFKRTTN